MASEKVIRKLADAVEVTGNLRLIRAGENRLLTRCSPLSAAGDVSAWFATKRD